MDESTDIKSILKQPEKRIDPNAKKAWRIAGIGFGLFWFILPTGYFLIVGNSAEDYSAALQIAFVLFSITAYIITAFVVPVLRWERWRYDLSENEIDLLRGFIIKKRTLIPINRVQHVDTSQGPVYRKFGLSSVKVSTAATTHEIPALNEEIAAEVRNRISQLVRLAKEDV